MQDLSIGLPAKWKSKIWILVLLLPAVPCIRYSWGTGGSDWPDILVLFVAGAVISWCPWLGLLRMRHGRWAPLGRFLFAFVIAAFCSLVLCLVYVGLMSLFYRLLRGHTADWHLNGWLKGVTGLALIVAMVGFIRRQWARIDDASSAIIRDYLAVSSFAACLLLAFRWALKERDPLQTDFLDFGVFWSCFACFSAGLVALYKGGLGSRDVRGKRSDHSRWQPKGLVKSASALSNTVLVVTLLSAYGAVRYESDLADLGRMRTAFVDDLLSPSVSRFEASERFPSSGGGAMDNEALMQEYVRITGNRALGTRLEKLAGERSAWLDRLRKNIPSRAALPDDVTVELVGFALQPPVYFGQRRNLDPFELMVRVAAPAYGMKWTATTALHKFPPPDPAGGPRMSETIAAIAGAGHSLAEGGGGDGGQPDSIWRSYQKAEGEILSRSVDVPEFDVSLPIRYAAALGMLAACPLLWYLADRARLLASLPTAAAEREQWMLFDAQGRLTRVFSTLWGMALVLCPVFLFALHVRNIELIAGAYGVEPSGPGHLALSICATLALGLFAWLTARATLFALGDVRAYFIRAKEASAAGGATPTAGSL